MQPKNGSLNCECQIPKRISCSIENSKDYKNEHTAGNGCANGGREMTIKRPDPTVHVMLDH